MHSNHWHSNLMEHRVWRTENHRNKVRIWVACSVWSNDVFNIVDLTVAKSKNSLTSAHWKICSSLPSFQSVSHSEILFLEPPWKAKDERNSNGIAKDSKSFFVRRCPWGMGYPGFRNSLVMIQTKDYNSTYVKHRGELEGVCGTGRWEGFFKRLSRIEIR